MLRQFGPSTLVAIFTGCLLAFFAFVPTVAVRYRRAGRLRLIDLLLLLAVMVYAVALWSYTLIPLPESSDYKCVAANFHPFSFIQDIFDDPAGRSLHNRALLQVVFNVFLFMPLGGFLRLLARRGVVLATAIGLVISALIETTQLTGIWGLYPCPYRTFDVDDILLNTGGALIGSLLALPILWLLGSGRPAPKIDHVTAGRRFTGGLADLVVFLIVGGGASVAWRAAELYLWQESLGNSATAADTWMLVGVPLAFELVTVLARGQTVGEIVVDIRPVENPRYRWLQRIGKFAFGVGPFIVLAGLEPLRGYWVLFSLLSFIMVFFPRDHRGLTGVVTRMRMVVDDAADGQASGQPLA
ncbi:MAG: VanZ family protein [Propionibacteriaceae bacterium]|jgi:glycopeptide antibiotics resistance protein|nr:VanZ family protein [Propionibacteriaceae bacterium]